MQKFMVMLLAFLMVSCSVSRGVSWDLNDEVEHYFGIYDEAPGLSELVIGNLKYGYHTKIYSSFKKSLQEVSLNGAEQRYIYYELNVDDSHYLFMFIAVEGDNCRGFFVDNNKKELIPLSECFEPKFKFDEQKVSSELMILHGYFVGLVKLDDSASPYRYGKVIASLDETKNVTERLLDFVSD